jgi:phosphomannomutase
MGRLDVADEGDHLVEMVDSPEPARYLVLGSGEFTYPPFRIAEELERRGHDVVVQSTTRSPVHVGGAIASAIEFSDNYGTGVKNYLYNQTKESGRIVVACHETPEGSMCPELDRQLGVTPLNFGEAA